jgi:hypothetical protein
MIVMGVLDIAIDDRNASFEHRGEIAQCLRRRWVKPREADIGWSGAVGNNVTIKVLDRTTRRYLRLNIDVAIECLESIIAAGLVRQDIGRAMLGTKSATALLWLVAASIVCGELGPNTLLMSLETFSNSILAIEKPPTSQPARVKATQGAGAFLPF